VNFSAQSKGESVDEAVAHGGDEGSPKLNVPPKTIAQRSRHFELRAPA